MPSTATANLDETITQRSTCNQEQIRIAQPREQLAGTQQYRDVGTALEESRLVAVENQREARGSVARSCLMHKQYAGATANGIYTIKIQDRDVSVMCDMAGGGWTVVGRGYQGQAGTWATTRDAVNPGVVPGASATTTARMSDYDINAIPKTVFKTVTTGYNYTRYFKGSCVYNSISDARGDCAISYSNESWASPRGDGASGENAGGLSDYRGGVANDGLFVVTSLIKRPANGWASGNGTVASATGTAIDGAITSLYIYVK